MQNNQPMGTCNFDGGADDAKPLHPVVRVGLYGLFGGGLFGIIMIDNAITLTAYGMAGAALVSGGAAARRMAVRAFRKAKNKII